MEDRRKLKKLVEIIGEQIKIEGNEWLVTELLETIGEVAAKDNISKHSVIQNINEYCIEDNIKKQAKEFYKSFPITEIKEQLINDYVKMEHERRRDDFENFCLCMYQQIEAITNYLHEKVIEKKWNSIKNIIVVKYKDSDSGKLINKSLKNEVFGTSNSWKAFPKFKSILFYFYYNKKAPLPYDYSRVKETFYELYQIRNQNHRQGKLYDFQQEILDLIIGNESKYYLKFDGFLYHVVSKIESFYIENTVNNTEIRKERQPNAQKNTLGVISPELLKLKDQMENKK